MFIAYEIACDRASLTELSKGVIRNCYSIIDEVSPADLLTYQR